MIMRASAYTRVCISVHSLFSWGCGHDDVCSVLPAIMENLMEFRTEACSEAAQQGLLVWLLKRIKVSPLLPHLHLDDNGNDISCVPNPSDTCVKLRVFLVMLSTM